MATNKKTKSIFKVEGSIQTSKQTKRDPMQSIYEKGCDDVKDESNATDICAYCANNDKLQPALYVCLNCSPYGRFMCGDCNKHHKKFGLKHDVKDLSAPEEEKRKIEDSIVLEKMLMEKEAEIEQLKKRVKEQSRLEKMQEEKQSLPRKQENMEEQNQMLQKELGLVKKKNQLLDKQQEKMKSLERLYKEQEANSREYNEQIKKECENSIKEKIKELGLVKEKNEMLENQLEHMERLLRLRDEKEAKSKELIEDNQQKIKEAYENCIEKKNKKQEKMAEQNQILQKQLGLVSEQNQLLEKLYEEQEAKSKEYSEQMKEEYQNCIKEKIKKQENMAEQNQMLQMELDLVKKENHLLMKLYEEQEAKSKEYSEQIKEKNKVIEQLKKEKSNAASNNVVSENRNAKGDN